MRTIIYSALLIILLSAGSVDAKIIAFAGSGTGGLQTIQLSDPSLPTIDDEITGITNISGDQVDFVGMQNLIAPSQGQARIEAEVGTFDHLFFDMQAGSNLLYEVQFNINAFSDGWVLLDFATTSGGTGNLAFEVDKNGENRFTARDDGLTPTPDFITGVTIIGGLAADDANLGRTGAQFDDIRQFRIGVQGTPPQPVPEPVTMFLIGTGLVGIASTRFRRKK